MRSLTNTVTMAVADADGICQSQTPAAGGVQNLTINGTLASGGVATLDVPRHVSITSAGNNSARTFTITGTDRYGNAITETIGGPNATTVAGAKNFATVTQVTVDDNTTGAVTVGSADEAEGPWLPMDHRNEDFNLSILGRLGAGAGLTWAIQYTLSDVQAAGFLEDDAVVAVDANLTGETADANGVITFPCRAIRQAISSHTAGGLSVTVQQSGY